MNNGFFRSFSLLNGTQRMKNLALRIRGISNSLETAPSYPYILVLAAGFTLLLISRRPQVLFNPQFWAEDGRNWYADAHNHGIIYSLTTPENGYFQTFSRLAAIVAQAFPLDYGPHVFVALAIAVQVAVALFLVSDRMATLLPERKWRVLLAFFYLALPHAAEVFLNVTNSQWHLALLACLILLAAKPVTVGWKAVDIFAVAIMAVSGPCCILLLPIAAVQFFRHRDRHLGILALILAAGSMIQLSNYLLVGREIRPQLGASIDLLSQILARHVFVSPLLGDRGFQKILNIGMWNEAAYIAISIIGIAALIFVFIRASTELRLLLGFAILIIAAGLASPAVTRDGGQWQVIASTVTATRYWFILTFSFAAVLSYFASTSADKAARLASYFGLFVFVFGMFGDWKIFGLEDLRFKEHAERYAAAPVGTRIVIRLNPQPGWEMTLIKK